MLSFPIHVTILRFCNEISKFHKKGPVISCVHTVPMETPQSMLEEPSSGSKQTQYLCRKAKAHISSETIQQTIVEKWQRVMWTRLSKMSPLTSHAAEGPRTLPPRPPRTQGRTASVHRRGGAGSGIQETKHANRNELERTGANGTRS